MKKNNKKNYLISTIILSILLFISISLSVILVFINSNIKYKNDENIVFFGDSMTSRYDVEKYYPKRNVINSGVSGNKSEDLIERINDDVYKYNPSTIFLLIGINDLNNEVDEEDIILNIQNIVNGIKINRPYAKLYIESVYPINKDVMTENEFEYANNFDNKDIKDLNEKIKVLCKENNIEYIDIYNKLTDENGNLKKLYTKDGLHLNNLGYLKITSILKKYITNN